MFIDEIKLHLKAGKGGDGLGAARGGYGSRPEDKNDVNFRDFVILFGFGN